MENEKDFQTDLPYSNIHVSQGLVFDSSYSTVERIDYNYKVVWKHVLSHLGELQGRTENQMDGFQKFIGVTHNNLWVLAKSGTLIAINTETGIMTKTFEWVDEYVDGERYRPNPTEAFIYQEDYLYSLGHYFLKINTKTLEVEKKKLMLDAFHDGNKIKIRTSSIQHNYISFIASIYGTSWEKIIGLFSIKEEKIIWTYQLFDNNKDKFIPVFNTPQLAENKLYILDNEKTLHIFEEDEQV